MGKSLFIVLAVFIMYSGAQGVSMSKSCSMVNGKMICNEQTSAGNAAMASSSANSGPQGSSQETYAGAGGPDQWDYSQQKMTSGNGGPSPSSDYFDFDRAEFQGTPRRFDGPVDKGCSYSSPGSGENFRTDTGPVVGGFGFASAGNIFRPQFPNFTPEIANIPQDSSESNGSRPPARNNFDNGNSGSQVSTGGFGRPPARNNFDNDNSGSQVSTGGFGGPSVGGMSYSHSSSGSAPNFGTNEGPRQTAGGFGRPPARNNFDNDNSGSQVSTGGFAGGPSVGGMSYSHSSSGSAPNFGTNEGPRQTAGGFAGGPSVGGMSYSYASSGSAPNFGTNQGPRPTVGGFGFASAGNTFSPGFPFSRVSGFVNGPQRDSSRPNGGGNPGGYAGGFPGGFAGGFAGAGAGNFGQPGGQPFDPFRFVFGRR